MNYRSQPDSICGRIDQNVMSRFVTPQLLCLLLIGVLLLSPMAFGQDSSITILSRYRVTANVTYMVMGSWEGKLDIYSRTDSEQLRPTLVWIHGGSSMRGSKDQSVLRLLPYLESGWNVVNVEHRLAGVTLAPAAFRNCLCALRWVGQNAEQYGFDKERLVVSGGSSGGWFAVASAMTRRPEGWDEPCPGTEEPRVAAVVNIAGNWDLADILEGPNKKPYAAGWVRDLPNPMEIARSLSPLPIDAKTAPPVVSIHGDADKVVPYSQAVRLHEALRAAGVSEQLITIPGGGHGGFTAAERQMYYEGIFVFLRERGIYAD